MSLSFGIQKDFKEKNNERLYGKLNGNENVRKLHVSDYSNLCLVQNGQKQALGYSLFGCIS